MKSFVILDKGATAAISRVKPQPEDGLHDHDKYPMSIDSDMKGFWGVVADTGEMKQFNAPYTIGQRVAVKESYIIENVGGTDFVVYRSDVPADYPTGSDTWRSPVTMPLSAVRTWAVVESVACVRVRDISEELAKRLLESSGKGELGSPICWRDYLSKGAKYCHTKDNMRWHWSDSLESYVIAKYGQSAWDNNEYIFITTFKIEQ